MLDFRIVKCTIRQPLEITRRIIQNRSELFSDFLWKKGGGGREALAGGHFGPKVRAAAGA
jgi:hypothetical protein